ncbi:symmetrical bis(5'-nucleosyl)-tetraphosphatase [uncultured Ferrimonas sp.]|uniref:symmetrical bis(5'-nucleosyl)-tetraphosphatase n=1 Tax=uncultured Ferrimonas sp. TaxID=432640 RepID=UPI002620A526|nr:symmetrical bis(5'-nucleosyl)-tetraphosphatase [uncultured Ferrimonas sp.]
MTHTAKNLFVGDIQGCFHELQLLLQHLDFDPHHDTLWVCGDMISRGPDSLATLRYIKALGRSAKVVLGNHDLHLFCVAAGLKRGSPKDRQQQLLAADDLPELIDWLRQQPLLQHCPQHNVVMTHAGIPPQWDLATATARAQQVQQILRGDNYLDFCQQMYGHKPDHDRSDANAYQRATYTVNALTRMRYLTVDGHLEFDDKTPPSADSVHVPWFAFTPHQVLPHCRVVFGHWASLQGRTSHPNAIALDTGCCWGGQLCIWHAEADTRYLIDAGGQQPVYSL